MGLQRRSSLAVRIVRISSIENFIQACDVDERQIHTDTEDAIYGKRLFPLEHVQY